jgi:hypothetical protein
MCETGLGMAPLPRRRLSRRSNVHRWPIRLTASLLGLASLAALPAAHAALGDTLASVQADSQRLKAATLRVQATGSYTVQVLQLPEGGTVNEYLTPAGTVFAVRWVAPFKPDLGQLLGRYFATYATAPRSAGSDRSHLAIEAGDLVVHAGGRPRAFAGTAWVPSLVPAGIDPAVLP